MNTPVIRNDRQITYWLETHFCAPAYSGWLLGSLALFFFGAASNTMAGWLYVISGVILAILGVAAVLPARSLKPLQIHRRPIEPITVGDRLTIELAIENQANQPKTLLQILDILPYVLGQPVPHPIEVIPAQSIHLYTYYHPTQRRGVYRWNEVELRTAAPLGLFWCRRSRIAKATAIVYPTVLPLNTCPLVDRMGQEQSPQFYDSRRSQMATEGITRTLRPYRHGDSTRLIHWRTSARYGELRVRELEVSTGSQEIIISLDSAAPWQESDFEQAVIAAASLYFYATKRLLNVKLWTAGMGEVSSNRGVLEGLAAVNAGEDPAFDLPGAPLIWLTQNPQSLSSLPPGSRWVLWSPESVLGDEKIVSKPEFPGLDISRDRPLELQLQSPLSRV
ncbi:hypothetical protein BCD67_02420 [Oscillatoriales cyanobacterium USR001]|nr:hypothetical protein BCD67_02420 [Oscillatoriales cyanobacterium USR001]